MASALGTRLWRRIRPHFVLKTAGITGFMTLFFVAYFHLLNHPIRAVAEMPLTAVDRALPFAPAALPIYLSLWLYVSLPPSLIVERGELERYGAAIGLVCLVGLGCFLLWPTAVPAMSLDWQGFPGAALLQGIDKAGNACPSLHVATAVFSAVWLHRILGELRASAAVAWASAIWATAIVLSTLLTRQHVFLDALAGIALGLAGAGLLWRWQAVRPSAAR